MKRDSEVMIDIVEALASGMQSLQGAALSNGVAVRTFWRWMQLSKDGKDERFLIQWPAPDGEPVPFHRAVAMARKMHALEVRAKFEKECLTGWDSEVRFQGAPVWRQHAGAFDPKKRELLVMLGECDEDGFMIDERGERLPVLEHHHAPVAAVTKFLETHFAEYRTHTVSDTNLNINGGLTLGVSTVPRRTREDGPPQIPAPPTPPRVVEVVKVIEAPQPINEPADDPVVTDTKPSADEPEVAAAPTPEQEPRVIREPAPPAYQPTASEKAGRPLSALETELLGRLRGDPAKRSASPIGSTASAMPRTPRPA